MEGQSPNAMPALKALVPPSDRFLCPASREFGFASLRDDNLHPTDTAHYEKLRVQEVEIETDGIDKIERGTGLRLVGMDHQNRASMSDDVPQILEVVLAVRLLPLKTRRLGLGIEMKNGITPNGVAAWFGHPRGTQPRWG